MPRTYTTVIIPRCPLEIRVPTPGPHTYLDTSELMDLVRQSGSHFFDTETMRAFKSKLYDIYPTVDGWLFITSEKHESSTSFGVINEPRRYTLRKLVVLPDNLRIVEVSKFQQFTSLGAARAAAKREL